MLKRRFIYIIFSIFSFSFFFYILFPGVLIKDLAEIKLQQLLRPVSPDLKVTIQSISSYWFTGVKINKIVIQDTNKLNDQLIINHFTLRISVLPLLIGRIGLNSNIQIENGNFEMKTSLSIYELIKHKKFILNEVDGDFNEFNLGGIFKIIISALKHSNDPSMSLIKPMLENSSLGGFVNGAFEYKNKKNFNSKFYIKLRNAFIDINNDSLNIPKQTFSNATLSAEYEDSNFVINKETAFKAENISFGTSGVVKKDENNQSNRIVNLKLNVAMSGQIDKNFGFLIPQLLKCPPSSMEGGLMNVKLIGVFPNLNCS